MLTIPQFSKRVRQKPKNGTSYMKDDIMKNL